jgi:hypothetical protein
VTNLMKRLDTSATKTFNISLINLVVFVLMSTCDNSRNTGLIIIRFDIVKFYKHFTYILHLIKNMRTITDTLHEVCLV